MLKMLAIVKRRADLDREAFIDHWHGEHASLMRRLPGLRRSCTNVSILIPGREPRIDLVSEAWWEDLDQLLDAAASPAGEAVQESLARVSDPAETISAILSERVVIPPPTGGPFVKNFVAIYRRPDLSLEAFDRYWWEEHPKAVNRLPGLIGYVQCPTVRVPGEAPAIDGCAIVWFESLDTLRVASRSPEMAAVRVDERQFIDQPRMVGIVTTVE